MPPNSQTAPPPPPRPDPVTLDLIYERLTFPDVPLEERAYHLVALSTVAFHPSVKLFLFEHTPINGTDIVASHTESGGAPPLPLPSATVSNDVTISAIAAENQKRREEVLKSAAFFLAQRSNAVMHECRWETVSLIGELCRMENLSTPSRNANGGSSNNAGHILSPMLAVAQKINTYAKANLEYLAKLPWFIPSIQDLIGIEHIDASSSNTAWRASRRPPQSQSPSALNDPLDTDEDVRLALKDILAALPNVDRTGTSGPVVSWTPGQLEQAQDLMFLDASTTMLHLIPLVAQSSHVRCAQCEKRGGKGENVTFLRCGSCKSVYYCGPECQRVHWTAAHRVPCKAYKERCDAISAQYEAMNSGKRKQQKKKNSQASVAILEVPLEPSLFFVTRRYLYDHRDASFADIPFDDYFMKYTVRGA